MPATPSDTAPATSNLPCTPPDVVTEVIAELGDRLAAARAAGIPAERLIIDPGLGFSKTAEHNWALVRAAERFQAMGYPVLWGHSRKRFLADAYPSPTTPVEREAATLALTYHLAARGAWAVRVHDVAGNRVVLTVAEAATDPVTPDAPAPRPGTAMGLFNCTIDAPVTPDAPAPRPGAGGSRG